MESQKGLLMGQPLSACKDQFGTSLPNLKLGFSQISGHVPGSQGGVDEALGASRALSPPSVPAESWHPGHWAGAMRRTHSQVKSRLGQCWVPLQGAQAANAMAFPWTSPQLSAHGYRAVGSRGPPSQQSLAGSIGLHPETPGSPSQDLPHHHDGHGVGIGGGHSWHAPLHGWDPHHPLGPSFLV